jgi:hypothetical protein
VIVRGVAGQTAKLVLVLAPKRQQLGGDGVVVVLRLGVIPAVVRYPPGGD